MRNRKSALVAIFGLLLGLFINSSNAFADLLPTVTWSSPANNSTVTGKITLKASAKPASSGTAILKSVCLTINGELATNSGAISGSDVDNYSVYFPSFNKGCWSVSSNYDLRSIEFNFDTTKWENKAYAFAIKVTDSSDRESTTATLTLTTANVGPTVTWSSPANNSTVTGKITLKASAKPASSGTAILKSVCLTINGELATNSGAISGSDVDNYSVYFPSFNKGCWSVSSNYDLRSIEFNFDTTKWENKAYAFAIKVTDSSDRESTTATLTLTTANVGPTVTWSSPANNSTVTGKITLKASAKPASSGTAILKSVCLTINGELATNSGAISGSDVDNYSVYFPSFNKGCWSVSSNYDLRSIEFNFDTTKWENKAYAFAIKVTDSSDRESTTATLTLTTANVGPTVTWSSPANNSTVTGKITLKASAKPASSGTAILKSVCLTINGELATNSGAISGSDVDNYSVYFPSFNKGCWSVSSNYDLRSIEFNFDTTKWENKAYAFAIKVTDSSDRESTTATLTLTTANVGPTVTWSSPANNSTVTGKITLKASAKPASSGTAILKSVCLTINGELATNSGAISGSDVDNYSVYFPSFNKGCWSVSSNYDLRSIEFNFDTTKWENKAYAFAIKVTDSSDRESTTATLTMTTNNPGPIVSKSSYEITLPSTESVAIKAVSRDFEVMAWCMVTGSDLGELAYFAKFGDKSNYEVSENAITFNSNCWTSNYDISNLYLSFDSVGATNGTYPMKLIAVDENGHYSETVTVNIAVSDPGLSLQITESGIIQAPAEEITVAKLDNGSARSIETIDWNINGESLSDFSEAVLEADPKILKPGKNSITATVTDNIGNTQIIKGTYVVKWTPTISVYGVDNYYFYSPATPKVTVKLRLGNQMVSGKVTLTASYVNGAGKKVSQKFDLLNGTGSLTLQSLSKSTNVTLNVPATAGTQSVSTSFLVDVRKRPPAPINTKISISAPRVTVWPKSFNATVSLTGKGSYSCTATFQDYYINFTMSAGSKKQINIQPTYLSESAEFLRGYCTGSAGAGTTFFDTWVIVSSQG